MTQEKLASIVLKLHALGYHEPGIINTTITKKKQQYLLRFGPAHFWNRNEVNLFQHGKNKN
jgi:hypothetical protein